MSKSLLAWSLLIFLGLATPTTSCAQKRTKQKQNTTVQKQRTESPEAMLKHFYTEYIRSFDRMYEPAQMDSLILANATPEAKAKLERVRALTDSDPFYSRSRPCFWQRREPTSTRSRARLVSGKLRQWRRLSCHSSPSTEVWR